LSEADTVSYTTFCKGSWRAANRAPPSSPQVIAMAARARRASWVTFDVESLRQRNRTGHRFSTVRWRSWGKNLAETELAKVRSVVARALVSALKKSRDSI